MPALTIAPATAADMAFLATHDQHLAPARLGAKVERGEVLVGRQAGAAVGLLRFGWFWNEIPFLDLLWIEAACRRQGIGRRLVAFWEAAMQARGARRVLTSTLADEEAQHFYRRLGYIDSGALLLPGEALEIILRKELSPAAAAQPIAAVADSEHLASNCSLHSLSAVVITGPRRGTGPVCAPILRALPGWFGIEEATQHYIRDLDGLDTWLARSPGGADPAGSDVVGFLAVARHFPQSAEIHVMGVHPAWHRRGVGRRLLAVVEAALAADGVRWLQVKTLSPARENEEYRRTRLFYERVGFVPLQEFPELWGAANPCRQLVKALAVAAAD